MSKLFFGNGNAKLAGGIFTFSLPSGHTCPFAHDCLAKANRETGRLKDGPNQSVRCFSASQEVVYKNVRLSRWRNLDLLRGKNQAQMRALICASLPPFAGVVRVHVSGDFFSQAYFNAWMETAIQFPRTLFYAYTKSLPFWVNYGVEKIPANFKLTASTGSLRDGLIAENGLKYSLIVSSKAEAKRLGLPLDSDDSHAFGQDKPFALMLHGNGPKGSEQARRHYRTKIRKAIHA